MWFGVLIVTAPLVGQWTDDAKTRVMQVSSIDSVGAFGWHAWPYNQTSVMVCQKQEWWGNPGAWYVPTGGTARESATHTCPGFCCTEENSRMAFVLEARGRCDAVYDNEWLSYVDVDVYLPSGCVGIDFHPKSTLSDGRFAAYTHQYNIKSGDCPDYYSTQGWSFVNLPGFSGVYCTDDCVDPATYGVEFEGNLPWFADGVIVLQVSDLYMVIRCMDDQLGNPSPYQHMTEQTQWVMFREGCPWFIGTTACDTACEDFNPSGSTSTRYLQSFDWFTQDYFGAGCEGEAGTRPMYVGEWTASFDMTSTELIVEPWEPMRDGLADVSSRLGTLNDLLLSGGIAGYASSMDPITEDFYDTEGEEGQSEALALFDAELTGSPGTLSHTVQGSIPYQVLNGVKMFWDDLATGAGGSAGSGTGDLTFFVPLSVAGVPGLSDIELSISDGIDKVADWTGWPLVRGFITFFIMLGIAWGSFRVFMWVWYAYNWSTV